MRQTLLLLLIGTLLCGCASLELRERDKAFETVTSTYARAIRWGEFAKAEQLRRLPDAGESGPLPPEHVRVTAYEILRSKPASDGNEATVEVRITYYHTGDMKLRNVTDRQVWKYDPGEQSWYITTPLPAFR